MSVGDAGIGLRDGQIAWFGRAAEAPDAARVESGDWFVTGGVTDHHVHTMFASPRDLLAGGITRAIDLAMPLDRLPEARSGGSGDIASGVTSGSDSSGDIAPGVGGGAVGSGDAASGVGGHAQNLGAGLSDGGQTHADRVSGARVECYGPMLTAPGGYCSRAEWAPAGTAWELNSPTDAAQAVETLAAVGVRGIKVALRNDVGPVLDMATLHAIVRSAEATNLRVAAHVQGDGMLDLALEAGVHELAHTPWTHDLTADQVARVAATVVTTPTLDIHRDDPDDLRRAIANTAAIKRAGGRFRYGTDIGNDVPAQVNPSEAKWMVEAGFSVDEILVAMACPVKLGSPLGVVAFEGDPFDDLDHLGRIALCAIG